MKGILSFFGLTPLSRDEKIVLHAAMKEFERTLPSDFQMQVSSEKMRRVKRTERGWAGHFICAHDCRFRRNILLECGDIKIVVSTVGAMYPPHKKGEIDTIGFNRYYETMAFHSNATDTIYNDANVSKQVSFDSNWALGEWNTPTIDNDADEMHEAVVKELSHKLKIGYDLKPDDL